MIENDLILRCSNGIEIYELQFLETLQQDAI